MNLIKGTINVFKNFLTTVLAFIIFIFIILTSLVFKFLNLIRSLKFKNKNSNKVTYWEDRI